MGILAIFPLFKYLVAIAIFVCAAARRVFGLQSHSNVSIPVSCALNSFWKFGEE
jgi:hypothetical protein